MNYTDYLQAKENFFLQLAPHKEVELTEIQHESDQLYSIDGVEVPASRRFVDSYDTIIGIKPKQKVSCAMPQARQDSATIETIRV